MQVESSVISIFPFLTRGAFRRFRSICLDLEDFASLGIKPYRFLILTDNKLYRKIIDKFKKIATVEYIELRQTYSRTLKQLYQQQRHGSHPENR